jgi:hypothetical protein
LIILQYALVLVVVVRVVLGMTAVQAILVIQGVFIPE